ncbi:MAG: hypothetical protein ABIK54_03755 [candidate division WOR-3 bacterium]
MPWVLILRNAGRAMVLVLFLSVALAQPVRTLYIPDSLGGNSYLRSLVYNPVLDRIYIYSSKSENIVTLDCGTNQRLIPHHDISPNFVFNPGNNRLYHVRLVDDSSAVTVYGVDAVTGLTVDSVVIAPGTRFWPMLKLDLSIPAQKVYCTTFSLTGDTVTHVIDCRTSHIIRQIPGLHWLTVFDTVRSYAYICTPAAIYTLDCEQDQITDSIAAPPDFQYLDLYLFPERELLTATLYSPTAPGRVQLIDCRNRRVRGELEMPVSGLGIARQVLNTVNNKLYVLAPYTNTVAMIYVIPVDSLVISDSMLFPLYQIPYWLLYNPQSNHLYAASGSRYDILFYVFDAGADSLLDVFELWFHFEDGLVHPALNRLYCIDQSCVHIFDCARRKFETAIKAGYLNERIMWQPVTNRLYVNDVTVDTFSTLLIVYDGHTNEYLKTVDLSHQLQPAEWFFHFTTATAENKIYLASGQSLGVYVLDGATDSLVNFIPGPIGGHYLLYNPVVNKLYAIPFSDFLRRYFPLYIIDCATDRVLNVIDVGQSGDGYCNPHTGRVYAAITYPPSDLKTFVICGNGDTVIRVLDSIGRPLAFRNKGNIHQVYAGCPYRDRIYVLDPYSDSIIDSVINVYYTSEPFFYYDSIDDRLYFPHGSGNILVIDCATNRLSDTISNCGIRHDDFRENSVWNVRSNRLYVANYDTASLFSREPKIMVIDCRTNTVIDSFTGPAKPGYMQWNYIDNMVYINDHDRARVFAFADDLIGLQQSPARSGKTALGLFMPSVGIRFVRQAGIGQEINIADISGRVVRVLGAKELIFDAGRMAPGVYFAFIRGFKPQRLVIVK